MKWFERMTVLQSLLVSFAAVIGFCVVVGGAGLMTLSSMHDLTVEIGSRHMDGLYWMEEANRNKIDADLAAANLGYAANEAGRQRLDANIVESLKNMHDAYDRYRATLSTSKGQTLLDEVLRKSAVWEEIVHQQIGQEPIPAGVDNNELVRRAIASSEALRDSIVQVMTIVVSKRAMRRPRPPPATGTCALCCRRWCSQRWWSACCRVADRAAPWPATRREPGYAAQIPTGLLPAI